MSSGESCFKCDKDMTVIGFELIPNTPYCKKKWYCKVCGKIIWKKLRIEVDNESNYKQIRDRENLEKGA